MHEKDKSSYNQLAGQKVQRIEAISDGVFAIAMTLLILDIKVPLPENIHTESQLWSAFLTLSPKLLSYLLGFMTLGIFWTGHATQYSFIEKSDRHLNWLSLFFLLFVSVLPFTTAFLSEYIDFKFSIGLYWLNIFLLGVILLIHWGYAVRHNYLSLPDEERAIVAKTIRRRIIYAQTFYAISALLCFFSTYLSVLMTILIQLNYALALFSNPDKKK
jgi:uncharacterized membrane protein